MTCSIIPPLFDNLFENLFDGLFDQDIFSLIWNGAPYSGTVFTRSGIAYASDPAGNPVEVAANVPAYEYSTGVKQYRNYSGTGTLPFPPGTSTTIQPSTLSLSTTAEKPWSIPSLDATPVNIAYGLEGLFNGVGNGVQLYDTDIQTIYGQCTYNELTNEYHINSDGTDSGVLFDVLSLNSNYETCIVITEITTLGGGLRIETGDTDISVEDIGGTCIRANSVNSTILKVKRSAGITDIKFKIISIRKVSPAIGRIIGETYIPHSLTEDLPIVQFTTGSFVPLYVEATTGLLKGTDGTNTCVSPSALVAGTAYNFIFTWEVDRMWITLGTTLGTEATFAGTFPDTGADVFGLTNGIYQTARALYFDNDLDSGNNEYLTTYLASFLGG
ncbi:MAG: hypothetical protein GY714_18330 [Desulfobacterales bacterium]|nr:hypothetical protein [Desulfobacterales bacterium]